MYSVLLPGGLGNYKTYSASHNGLRWLNMIQNEDGSWGTSSNKLMATGLAALSYLYLGEMPGDSYEFGETLETALDYLVRECGKSGQMSQSHDELGVAVATTALAEFYRKIWNPNVKASAEAGLRCIISQQGTDNGLHFGNDASCSNRLVATAWNVIALETGMKARLLNGSSELRDAIGLEAASLSCFSNILSQIQPRWPGSTPTASKGNGTSANRPTPTLQDGNLPSHLLFLATRRSLNLGTDYWKRWFDRLWPPVVNARYATPAGEPGTKCNCPFCHTGIFGGGFDEPYHRDDGRAVEIGHWVGLCGDADSIIIDTSLAILDLTIADYQFRFNFRIDEVPLPKPSTTNDVEVDFGI